MTIAAARPPEGLVERLRGWLARAPAPVFALYGGLMAFGAYFAMYAFRKPFTVAEFADVAPVVVKFKVALVIAQVFGYALSKLMGVKLISETPPHRRALGILGLIGAAELALVLFALIPAPWNIACLFANGLALGLIWGLVFGFLEGRRLSEPLGAMLCVSFIVSSGVVKSAGAGVMLHGWANEWWMPALTGLLFAPLLLVCVGGLAILPPPSPQDERLRVARAPMDAKARSAMFGAYAPGLVALIAIYVGLTALRDFRDNFAAEIWAGLGFKGDAEIFTLSELPVALVVLVSLSLVMFVRDNRRAFIANLVLVAAGLALAGLSTLAFQSHAMGPVAWMIALGAGLYLAYTPFNALMFDRFIAASGRTGTAGFLIYVADAAGYASSVGLLVARDVVGLRLSWVQFLMFIAYVTAAAGLLLLAGAGVYFYRRLMRKDVDAAARQSSGDRRLYATRGGHSYGEGVSQLEHALQCAALAEAQGAPPTLIAAALLHDIGHLLAGETETVDADDRHEAKGAQALAGLFGPEVRAPIALHVAAKRYLCAREPGYFAALSPASQASLALQGGPLGVADAAAFEHRPFSREAVALRRLDDLGKRPEPCGRTFADFTPALQAALAQG